LYENKKRDLQILKQIASDGVIDVTFFDESGFNLRPNIPYAWTPIGKTLSVPAKISKNLSVLGFLNVASQKLYGATTSDRVDSDMVIGVFDLFADEITKRTIVVLDNASIHKSKKFKSKIEDWEEKGLFLFYLSPYSPQLNPIEILWRFMKYQWIDFNAYVSFDNLKEYVEKVLIEYGTGDYEICFG